MMISAKRAILGVGGGLLLTTATLGSPAMTQAETIGGLECTITGTAGPDVLRGTSGDDVICGLGGNDVIYGGDGDDILIGGDGNDVISGGNGDDIELGENGKDVLSGNAGDDKLNGGAGNDVLLGGDGDDILIGGAGKDELAGGAGNNQLTSAASNERGFEADMRPVYNLPAGSEVTWTHFQDNPKCVTRAASSWLDRVESTPPDIHFLLEGTPSAECLGKTVHYRWRVKIQTPDNRTKIAHVTVDVNFPSRSSVIPEGTTSCTYVSDGLQCSGASAQQKFTPLLPLFLHVNIGPFGE